MDGLRFPKKDWSLTREAFDNLLACLDQDRERAAEKYEQIRLALITYFEHRGCLSPEEYADETINRAARRLSEGQEIYTNKAANYFYGVARNLLKEYWGAPERQAAPLESLTPSEAPPQDPGELQQRESQQLLKERYLECLDRCLQALTPQNRETVIRYYQGETEVKIKNRKRLANELGIPPNALRNRVLRIRERLEDCVNSCLGRSKQG
jgi:RNA polymerase sigma factor (sigma-70 family)